MTRPLLIELGCEELPARLLEDQARQLLDGLLAQLEQAGVSFQNSGSRWYATPRRLAVMINAVAPGQPDRTLQRKGPAWSCAFDSDGNPTPAALGFAGSVGLPIEALERLDTDQGAWLLAHIEQPGRTLAELLPELLEPVLTGMAGSRSMRWAARSERFLRPVRWLVALYGEEVLPVNLFGLTAGRETLGHRIHSPGPHAIAGTDDYVRVLRDAFVVADPAARRSAIEAQIHACAAAAGFEARPQAALLDEVVNLTEWPKAVAGRFEPEFLEVPAEALIASMQHHQKTFPLFDPDGQLVNAFVAVANLDSRDPDAMREGFERVIRPRLADARFFWDQDRKKSLEDHARGLSRVVFQEKLGSLADKTARVGTIAAAIAARLELPEAPVARAAALCKADLLTGMVGEFPELQGVMGRHYALASGEDAAIATAIESHYRPRFAADELPTDPIGRVLALADRLDTLLGVFAAGQKPRGSKDPFALRRAALGVVRLLVESRWPLTLHSLLHDIVAPALSGTLPVDAQTLAEVEGFVLDRLKSHLSEHGAGHTVFAAVLAGRMASLADFADRAQAVSAFTARPEAEGLIAANKRIQNIMKQNDDSSFGAVSEKLLKEAEEQALFEALRAAESAIAPLREKADYAAILAVLSGLHAPVAAFFDQVLVMSDDTALRNNRLALLARLRQLVADIADMAVLGV